MSIITVNIGHSNANKYIAGDSAKAKEALKTLLMEKKPTVLFLQESSMKNIPQQYKFQDTYGNTFSGDEDNFLFDLNEVELESVDIAEIDEIRKKIMGNAEGDLPIKRIPMAIANPKNNSKWKFAILLVSWHGPHKGFPLEKKKVVLKCMLEIVTTVSTNHHLPFIIGGDFNLPMHETINALQSSTEIEVHRYASSFRRPKMVDFFISSNPLKLINIEPVRWNSEENERILDHDPISAKLQFDCTDDFEQKDEPNKTDSGTIDQETPNIKREDTECVKEEDEQDIKDLIKREIVEDFQKEIEGKINEKIAKYVGESSKERKEEIKNEIIKEFDKKMNEFILK